MGAGRQRWWNRGRYEDECRAFDAGEPFTADLVSWWRRQHYIPPLQFAPIKPDDDGIEMRVRCYLPICGHLHDV